MPYIQLQIAGPATREQKQQIIAEFTDTLVRVLDKKPEHTHIVIQEVDPQNWGFMGLSNEELARRAAK